MAKLPKELHEYFVKGTPIVALSPHIDDAIWSMGGLLETLARAGHEITLVSIFSHSIFVYGTVRPPIEATHVRKGEDLAAAHAAGFKSVQFLDFPDGILRDKAESEVLDSTYQTPEYLLKMVTECLDNLLPANAILLVPAAFGGHMDHLTVRRAALPLKQRKVLYEDLPYSTRAHGKDEAEGFLQDNQYKNVRVPLDTAAIEKHRELFWKYGSQASDEVADEIDMYLSSNGVGLWVA